MFRCLVVAGDATALIAKGTTSDTVHGWYRADVANADGDQTATVYTNIENTMEKFNVVHVAVKTTLTLLQTAS